MLIQYFYVIVGLIFVAINRKTLFKSLFLEPIRGGNGVTQMDELAKYVIIILSIVVTFYNLTSTLTLQILLGSLVIIAGIQKGSEVWKTFLNKGNKKEDAKNNHHDSAAGSDGV